jgi:hypothetical protein
VSTRPSLVRVKTLIGTPILIRVPPSRLEIDELIAIGAARDGRTVWSGVRRLPNSSTAIYGTAVIWCGSSYFENRGDGLAMLMQIRIAPRLAT